MSFLKNNNDHEKPKYVLNRHNASLLERQTYRTEA